MAGSVSRLQLTSMLQIAVCMVILCASFAALVEDPSVVLTSHDGPLLSSSGVISVHLIRYGKFTSLQCSIIVDFLQSLGENTSNQPSASTWWKTMQKYRVVTSNKAAPSSAIILGKQKVDQDYSLGKSLNRSDIAALVEADVKSRAPPLLENNDESVVYLVLTSEDVAVEGFSMSSCGFHENLNLLPGRELTGSRMMGEEKKQQQLIPYAWVGNFGSQCPGQCVWPFHQHIDKPQTPPLGEPNGDMGIDGMIINIATVFGAVTNPFNTSYFQGDANALLEAVSACMRIYGKGAYAGFSGVIC